MTFGEKLFKLRKEKGFSQEALAEQIGTTRQAISKWENNQGFPETEKLLQLSNIFEITIDSLLKDEKSSNDVNERGYYVSKETFFYANILASYQSFGASESATISIAQPPAGSSGTPGYLPGSAVVSYPRSSISYVGLRFGIGF